MKSNQTTRPYPPTRVYRDAESWARFSKPDDHIGAEELIKVFLLPVLIHPAEPNAKIGRKALK